MSNVFPLPKNILRRGEASSKQDVQHFETPLSNKERLTRDKQTLNSRRMLASCAI